MQFPNFIGGAFRAQSPIVNQELTQNWYVEISEARGSLSPASLYPTPGASLLSTAGGAPGKANYVDPATGRQFMVIGNKLIEASSSGAQTVRGTVAVDANPATISGNGAGGGQLFVTSGTNGYIYDLDADTLTAVAALAGKATMGDQIDGYFLALDAATGTVYFSNLAPDGDVWDTGTDFFSRNSAADPWIAMKVLTGLIFLLGSETGDTFFDSGESPVPFVPTSTGVIQYGIAAPFSMEVADGALYWLGRTSNGQGMVLRATGARPEVVSNRGLEYTFSHYDDLTDAIGDTYTDDGHTFYILTFQASGATWCFDPSVPPPMAWHMRSTRAADSTEGAWRMLFHAFAYGRHTMLDIASGGLYHMSSEFGTDVDELAIRRVRRTPGIIREGRRLYYPCLRLGLETGLGLQSGQGSNPMVMMRQSNDGGKTFGNERWKSAGAVGQYQKRVEWLACGSAALRVFEVSVTDPVPWRLYDAWLPGFEQANQKAAA